MNRYKKNISLKIVFKLRILIPFYRRVSVLCLELVILVLPVVAVLTVLQQHLVAVTAVLTLAAAVAIIPGGKHLKVINLIFKYLKLILALS